MPSNNAHWIMAVVFCTMNIGLHHPVSGFQQFPSTRRASTTRWYDTPDKKEAEFGFQSITPKPIIPVTINPDDVDEINARQRDEPMFTASVRRDLYNIMRNPFQPHLGAPAPLSWWGGYEDDYEESSQFGGVLLGKRTVSDDDDDDDDDYQGIYYWDTFAFTDRMSYDPSANEGFTVLNDNQILFAISIMGTSDTAHAIALTKAFEVWLKGLAASYWGDLEASQLSVEFLIAFGNELTDRLGVNHRILSTTLTQEEMKILSEPQFAPYILPDLLEDFQTSVIEVDEPKAQAAAENLWWDQDDKSPEY